MGSFVMQDFLGSGVLKDLSSKLAEDGWDDVPTLKVIGAEDMEALELTDAQRVSFFFFLPFAHIYSSPWTQFAESQPLRGVVLTWKPCASQSREEGINWQ